MHDHQLEAKAIEQALNQANNLLIISHQSPDGDTLSSACAWIDWLLQCDKKIQAYCADAVPSYLQYLPHSYLFISDTKLFEQKYDLVLILDSPSLDYAGVTNFIPLLPGQPKIINIDHHISNLQYGDYNLLLPTASSTAEIIWRLFNHWHHSISTRLATSLLTGIITDTNGLTNPATKHLTLEIVADLVSRGANFQEIYQATHEQKTINQLRLWGVALSRLQKNSRHNIAVTYIHEQDLLDHKETPEAVDGIANYLAVLQEANIILVLKQEGDLLKGSLRTPFDHVDVNKIAKALGGGGHKKSAGFTLEGKLVVHAGGINIE